MSKINIPPYRTFAWQWEWHTALELGRWSLLMKGDFRPMTFKVETMLGMDINRNPSAAVTAYLVYDHIVCYGEWSLA